MNGPGVVLLLLRFLPFVVLLLHSVGKHFPHGRARNFDPSALCRAGDEWIKPDGVTKIRLTNSLSVHTWSRKWNCPRWIAWSCASSRQSRSVCVKCNVQAFFYNVHNEHTSKFANWIWGFISARFWYCTFLCRTCMLRKTWIHPHT
jgi:hypothetical protein